MKNPNNSKTKFQALTLILLALTPLATTAGKKDQVVTEKKPSEASIHIHEHKDFDSFEDFLHEFYNNATDHLEVKFIKNTFTNIDVHLNPTDYAVFLQRYLEENTADLDGHEDVIKEHRNHNEVLAKAYLQEREEEHGPTEEFELKDAYMDLIEGDFMFYLDTVEVKTPDEIKEEEDTHKEMDLEVEQALKNEKDLDKEAEKYAAQETTEELDL